MNAQSALHSRVIIRHLLALLLGLTLFMGMAGTSAEAVTAAAGSDHLAAGEPELRDTFLVSPNGQYFLRMQSDGNLVVYAPGNIATWSSRTGGNTGAFLRMQSDGNLVVYSSSGIKLWASETFGRGASTVVMQDDGNLVVYTNTSPRVATWSWVAGLLPPPPSTSEKLSDAQARQMLRDAGISVTSSGMCTDRNNRSCTSLEQIRRATITGVIAFKQASSCAVTVTAGTEVGHASGTYTHWNGYKVDISKVDICVTNYIHNKYLHLKNRDDGAPQYKSPAGDIYADEWWKSHWDILYY